MEAGQTGSRPNRVLECIKDGPHVVFEDGDDVFLRLVDDVGASVLPLYGSITQTRIIPAFWAR